MSTERFVEEDGAFCMAFWMPFQKKTILEMIQNCSREVLTVFLFTNWCMLLEKIHLHSAEINVEFEKNDFQKDFFSIFQLASLFLKGGTHTCRNSENSSSPGPSKRQIRHSSLLTCWPLTRGEKTDQVGCTPNNRIAVGTFLFGWERPSFQQCWHGFLKGHGFYILNL